MSILVGDDTGLLILLCYYADIYSKGLYLKPEPRQKTKTPRIWDIKKLTNLLGEQICACILFVHALLGCDTTSRVHGIGKPAALKKILTSDYFSALAQTMNRGPGTPKEEIIAADEQALVFVCIMESLEKALMIYATHASRERWQEVQNMLRQKTCRQLLQQ